MLFPLNISWVIVGYLLELISQRNCLFLEVSSLTTLPTDFLFSQCDFNCFHSTYSYVTFPFLFLVNLLFFILRCKLHEYKAFAFLHYCYIFSTWNHEWNMPSSPCMMPASRNESTMLNSIGILFHSPPSEWNILIPIWQLRKGSFKIISPTIEP